MRDPVQEMIDRAVEQVNELLPAGAALSNDPGVVLLGPNGSLDSMGFVNLQVALEQQLEEKMNLNVVLADFVADTPDLRTLGDLKKLLERIIHQKKQS